ncbi:MAG TPA: cytochrome c oxidase subunit II [Vitreimonas sp.]|nr:cytochrome c oxidase subunit II [Vitreimonas sp.]
MSRAMTLLPVALLVAGCLPQPVTAEGRDITATYTIFLIAAAVVAAIVLGSTTWAIVRYRRGRVPDLPVQTRGNVRAEAIWTFLPAVTVVGLFIVTVLTLVRIDSPDAAPGAEVEVSAFRWGWTFRYPEEDITVSGIGAPGPEIVVPVDEPVRFRISAADVIHSFYVPAFLQKRDANPGRENVMQVTIEEPGTYRGQCAEFCGLYHWRMPFAVRAVAREEYEAWLAEQPRGADPSVPVGSPLASDPGLSPAPTAGQPLESP